MLNGYIGMNLLSSKGELILEGMRRDDLQNAEDTWQSLHL